MAEERWLPVRRYAGFYEASDLGRVYSLPRAATAGGLLALPLNSRGYHVVTLSKYGRTQTLLVARIVLETFDSPADGRRAWHGPKGPGDDSLANLEWRLPGPRRLPGRRERVPGAARVLDRLIPRYRPVMYPGQ